MGAVSSTTKALRASLTMRENAWNTATSSVQGDCRSSCSSAMPAASRSGDLAAITLAMYFSVSALGSMRSTLRPGRLPSTVTRRWSAGSVVLRCTEWPRCTSPAAMAAATVVFPTPPLPITMMSPRPGAASASVSAVSVWVASASGVGAEEVAGDMLSGVCSSARSAGKPTVSNARSGIWSCGSACKWAGMAASACVPKASNAVATASSATLAWNTPLMASRWLCRPKS